MMGFRSKNGVVLEDKMASMVQIFIEVAAELGSSLAQLERNTREIFWWTSWAIVVALGLFILHSLVRIRAQLRKLNTYQDVFHQMWLEDRASDEKDRNERRERHKEAMRNNNTKLDDYLNVLTDQADNIAEEGTEEYDDLVVEDLREEMFRMRQRT
ncbi:hypothetical protein F5Y08DRAFT_317171 [Xylaria arbuscula]|nr:hypothetical protein F5Y08DRAFT_317171 [Xylaria arbuscula]